MATDYHPLDVVGGFIQSQGKIGFKPGAVQSSSHTNDTIFGQSCCLKCQIGHGIHRVGDHYDNGIGQCSKMLLATDCTIPALIPINSSRVIPGFLGTPE